MDLATPPARQPLLSPRPACAAASPVHGPSHVTPLLQTAKRPWAPPATSSVGSSGPTEPTPISHSTRPLACPDTPTHPDLAAVLLLPKHLSPPQPRPLAGPGLLQVGLWQARASCRSASSRPGPPSGRPLAGPGLLQVRPGGQVASVHTGCSVSKLATFDLSSTVSQRVIFLKHTPDHIAGPNKTLLCRLQDQPTPQPGLKVSRIWLLSPLHPMLPSQHPLN